MILKWVPQIYLAIIPEIIHLSVGEYTVRFQNDRIMKTLYIIACCLFLAAIACDETCKNYYTTAMVIRAKSMRFSDLEKAKAIALADTKGRIGLGFGLTGLLTAGIAVVAWIMSAIKGGRAGKRLTPVIPLILCVVYLMEMLTKV